ncbi:MAG: HK97-gp10 family putative phage morphogenesis protein [Pseudomonadota bacterium]
MSPVEEWNADELLAEISGRLINGMDKAMSFAAEKARAGAPVGATGRVQKLVDYEVVPEGNDVVGRVGVNKGKDRGASASQGEAFYWRFHEYGTRKLRARPFVRPAVFENGDEITRLIAEG